MSDELVNAVADMDEDKALALAKQWTGAKLHGHQVPCRS